MLCTLDHGDEATCYDCIESGFYSSVMIDASHERFEENVAITNPHISQALQLVETFKAAGILKWRTSWLETPFASKVDRRVFLDALSGWSPYFERFRANSPDLGRQSRPVGSGEVRRR